MVVARPLVVGAVAIPLDALGVIAAGVAIAASVEVEARGQGGVAAIIGPRAAAAIIDAAIAL